MRIFENYNTAKQKYGLDIVNSLSKLGLPPQYLLAACRFVTVNEIPQQRVVALFKEWTKYVAKYNKNTDVNKLSFEQFFNLIGQEKSKHCIPNLIYYDKYASLGKLNNAKDVQGIPVKNQWCIKSQSWFDRYISKGYVFFVIYLPNEPLPLTFVIAAICDGNVEYFDTQDYEQFEDLRGGNENNSDHEIYQSKLPKQIVSYLYNIAANQTEQIEKKHENTKTKETKDGAKVKLTVSQLYRIIRETVRKLLHIT